MPYGHHIWLPRGTIIYAMWITYYKHSAHWICVAPLQEITQLILRVFWIHITILDLSVGGLHIGRKSSPILDNIYRKFHTFEIGRFEFRVTEWLEYEGLPDYSIYDIINDVVTVPFQVTIVDVSAHCGYQFSINLTEFIWKYISVFAVKMYAIVCVPSSSTFLYLNHHRAVSDRWTAGILCDDGLEEFRLILHTS